MVPLDLSPAMEFLVDWVREHFFEILIGAGALLVLSWLYHHAARLLAGKPKGRFYCRHCNWEGVITPKARNCGKCGSRDLLPVTH